MENEDMTNISHRKMVKEEVEKLREKVSKENAKIIKMKVTQDAACWDLKNKLEEVVGNRDRLQQNLVEIQMQYETVSGQYQEELRLRPDTLNKLSTTRKITDILEEYVERLKESLSRCKADQSNLYKAIQESELVVRDLLQKNQEVDEKNRQVIEALQEKVNTANEREKQFCQLFSEVRQQAEAQVAELREKLEEAFKNKEELLANINELQRNLDLSKFDLEKKEQTLSNLQMERQQLIQEFNKQRDKMNSTMKILEKDFKEAEEIKLSQKKELDNQQQIAKSMCEHNNFLQEKLKILEEQKANLDATICELKYQLLENSNTIEKLQYEVAEINGEKKRLLKEIEQNEQLLASHKEEIEVLKQQITTIQIEKCEIISDMKKALEGLHQQKHEIENKYQNYRETSENKEKEFMRANEARDQEMDSKASTITQLMSELKISTDVRSKLEMTIQKYKKEIDDMTEKEKISIENLIRVETELKNKDQMWSEKLSFVIENHRIEKERQEEKIRELENTIENIRSEVRLHRPTARKLLESELDDNAVMLSPRNQAVASTSASPHQNVNSLNLPSLENSMERDDSLDTLELNRRFFAITRGEPLPPVPVSSLLRRNVEPATSQDRPKPRTRQSSEAQHPHNQGPKNAKTYNAKFFKTKQGEINRKKPK